MSNHGRGCKIEKSRIDRVARVFFFFFRPIRWKMQRRLAQRHGYVAREPHLMPRRPIVRKCFTVLFRFSLLPEKTLTAFAIRGRSTIFAAIFLIRQRETCSKHAFLFSPSCSNIPSPPHPTITLQIIYIYIYIYIW